MRANGITAAASGSLPLYTYSRAKRRAASRSLSLTVMVLLALHARDLGLRHLDLPEVADVNLRHVLHEVRQRHAHVRRDPAQTGRSGRQKRVRRRPLAARLVDRGAQRVVERLTVLELLFVAHDAPFPVVA